MVNYLQKYKQVIINAIILIALLIAFIAPNSNLKDGMLGFAFGGTLIMLGESINNLKREKSEDNLSEKRNISSINEL